MAQFCKAQLCGLGSAWLENSWAVRGHRLKPRISSWEKKRNKEKSEIFEMIVSAWGVREKQWHEQGWNGEKNQWVKKRELRMIKNKTVPRTMEDLTLVHINNNYLDSGDLSDACTGDVYHTHFSLVTPSYLLCVSSQWILDVHLKTVNVQSLLVEPLHMVRHNKLKVTYAR